MPFLSAMRIDPGKPNTIMKPKLNICAVLGLLLAAWPLFAAEPEEGFKPLFNGRDLSGWLGSPTFWSVRDGAITGQTTKENPAKGNTFLIWTNGALDDFELRASFKIVANNNVGFANSGIQYRSKVIDPSYWVVGGYQGDFEAGKTYSGILYEERGRGILAQRGQMTTIDERGKVHVVGSLGNSADIQAAIKNEDWNDYTILARGNHLTHVINGRVTIDVTDNDAAHRSFSGVLALQLHAGQPMTVQFKDIRVKRLQLAEGRKKIVMVAGHPSHGPGAHEFNAGVQLLNKCLQHQPNMVSAFYLNGWPKDPSAFDNADGILLFMDGGGGHPAVQEDHLQQIDRLMSKGVGLACAHYAVEVPKENGGPEFQRWIGGYYETAFSTNPHWTADFQSLPDHPITRGVKPFSIKDEWYFNMRFRPNMEGVTPILVAKPSDETRQGKSASPRGPYPHIVAAAGREEVLAWAVERPDGGRGFGFTGAHFHANWGNENFRKLVLNALLWVAKADVPEHGVECAVTPEDLKKNLDPKRN